ncbi:MAG: hypothetical protein IT168_21845 [Bryobacterales bacterium]|nr:hypothetical protein [Bryobacterales bacterium]
MRAVLFPLFVGYAFAQQPAAAPKPFTPTAALGKPYVIGEDPDDYGKIKVDYAKKFEITLDAVESALHFPNKHGNVLAKADQKLIVFRGTARNLSPETEARLTSGEMFAIRVWKRFEGPGRFQFILGYDPATLAAISTKIPPGGSAKFIEVIEVPAAYTDLQLGIYLRNRARIAWYDLRPVAKLNSAFAGPDGLTALQTAKIAAGSPFDFDGLDMRVTGSSRHPNGFTVDLHVTNKMLLPSRWGWQYFTAELIGADGAAIRFYPEVLDTSTGRPWDGDLPAAASTTGRYTFTTSADFVPRALRLTSAATGRIAEVALVR